MIPGTWVSHNGRPAIVVEDLGVALRLHLVDENGETVMRESNDVDPMNGNPRTHVAAEEIVLANSVDRLRPDRIPSSRQMPAEPEA